MSAANQDRVPGSGPTQVGRHAAGDSKPHDVSSSYFSDRCPKTVFGNEIATPCSLKVDHEGPCKPTPLPKSTVSTPHDIPKEDEWQSHPSSW